MARRWQAIWRKRYQDEQRRLCMFLTCLDYRRVLMNRDCADLLDHNDGLDGFDFVNLLLFTRYELGDILRLFLVSLLLSVILCEYSSSTCLLFLTRYALLQAVSRDSERMLVKRLLMYSQHFQQSLISSSQ